MGADGGTIPKRCELVKKKKKVERVDKNVENVNRWGTCQITQEPLKKPIVACKLGRMYNKEAILEARLAKTLQQNETTKHIRSLADVKELQLTGNRDYRRESDAEKGDTYMDYGQTQFQCPVTGLGMNGVNEFVLNWNCGCVISARALTEVATTMCPSCSQAPIEPSKMIKLYPDDDTMERYRREIADEEVLRRAEKKERKEKASVGSTTAEEKGIKAPKRKIESSEVGSAAKKGITSKASSLQNDPRLPESVKAMFTSSASAQRQPKAHWVTHNPLYF